MRKYRAGQQVMVSLERPIFTEDGLIMEPYERQATFLEHTPKPWESESCRVDFGNGSRKCVTTRCRRLRLSERIPWQAIAESLQRAGF